MSEADLDLIIPVQRTLIIVRDQKAFRPFKGFAKVSTSLVVVVVVSKDVWGYYDIWGPRDAKLPQTSLGCFQVSGIFGITRGYHPRTSI